MGRSSKYKQARFVIQMKVAIVGTRTYPDLEQVRQYVRDLSPDDIIVSGGAIIREDVRRLSGPGGATERRSPDAGYKHMSR